MVWKQHINRLPTRIVNILRVTILKCKKLVLALVLADKCAAQLVLRTICFHGLGLLGRINVDILALT